MNGPLTPKHVLLILALLGAIAVGILVVRHQQAREHAANCEVTHAIYGPQAACP